MSFWGNFNKKELIAAHRGYRARRAENTLLAFKAAKGKCDFIELDVGFSKDLIPIIIHDDTLERTTNAKELEAFKEPYSVIDYSLEELKKLDFSSWFIKDDPFGTIKSGLVAKKELESLPIQKVLTLKDALEFIKQNSLKVNIELKDMSSLIEEKLVIQEILSIVKSLNMDSSILLSSFNHSYLKELKKEASNISTAALFEEKYNGDLIFYLKELKVSAYHCNVEIVDIQTIKELKQNNFKIAVYTVNSKEEKNRLFNLGVDAIFTDFL